MAYIYKITNDINDKVYIGQTTRSIKERFNDHRKTYILDKYKNRPLYKDMNQYGFDHFKITLIEECGDNIADEKEQYWIEYYDSFKHGYNGNLGGKGRKLDHDRIYELYKMGVYIDDICAVTGSHRRTVLYILEEYGISTEDKRSRSSEHFSKPVVMMDKDTLEELKVFKSVREAARYLDKRHTPICDVCKGRYNTAYGYKWKYLNDYDK